ncbi:hypothetical protein HID58_083249 [Brassica napus]|uniref:Bifunctional inhibitor/plant lipid transfer protein/seed storage helical domain-containing protein n=1 Tax=Brassica napus TaxID=3708 RepID=A0ABQ7YFG8_BRANA|nr:hypothetical protein HID58_083249 [Brassica napus]
MLADTSAMPSAKAPADNVPSPMLHPLLKVAPAQRREDFHIRAKPILAENIIFLGSVVPISHAVTKTSFDFFTNPVILSEKYLKTTPIEFQYRPFEIGLQELVGSHSRSESSCLLCFSSASSGSMWSIHVSFVQLQAQPCCSSLNQNYSQQLTCLCLFLNKNSTLSSDFPIHQKLELQLPQLCSIPPAQFIWASSVSPPSINSTGSQVSLGDCATNGPLLFTYATSTDCATNGPLLLPFATSRGCAANGPLLLTSATSIPEPNPLFCILVNVSVTCVIHGLRSLSDCKHWNASSATAITVCLTSVFVSNPSEGSTISWSLRFCILRTAMFERLISWRGLVMSTAGSEEISSISTTAKLYTSLLLESW